MGPGGLIPSSLGLRPGASEIAALVLHSVSNETDNIWVKFLTLTNQRAVFGIQAGMPLFLHVQYLLPCYKLQVFEAYVCAENSERESSQQQLSEDNLEVCDTDCMWLFGIP